MKTIGSQRERGRGLSGDESKGGDEEKKQSCRGTDHQHPTHAAHLTSLSTTLSLYLLHGSTRFCKPVFGVGTRTTLNTLVSC